MIRSAISLALFAGAPATAAVVYSSSGVSTHTAAKPGYINDSFTFHGLRHGLYKFTLDAPGYVPGQYDYFWIHTEVHDHYFVNGIYDYGNASPWDYYLNGTTIDGKLVATHNFLGFLDYRDETGTGYTLDHFYEVPPTVLLDFSLHVDQTVGWTFTVETVEEAVPEAATWAMMIAGFGLAGLAARRRGGASKSLG